MSPSEEQSVIGALHAMEVRFTERLARIEAEASAWRKTHNELRGDIQRVEDNAKESAKAVALIQAADKQALLTEILRIDKSGVSTVHRLTIGVIVIGLIAAGRLGVNIFQMIS